MLRVSVITVCYNAEYTIETTITSVLNQSYSNIQYIIIDGNSTDDTMNIVNIYANKISIIVSESDKGLYDAINKGIALADGEVIGILNADDVFFDNSTIAKIMTHFEYDTNIQSVIGDIVFKNNNKILRYYSSKYWTTLSFRFGIMPPHPSFYCRRDLFTKYGNYRTDFKIAADFELLLRFILIKKVNYKYINNIIVLMKPGGLSSKNLFSQVIITDELLKACNLNGIYTNRILISFRYLIKVFQFIPNIKFKQS
jgi:glycosyltransferase involved in cell wall biosynthesis